jgi:biotin carboxylase
MADFNACRLVMRNTVMGLTLAEDKEKYIVLYINDFFPEFATAFTELSKRVGRPLRGIMLIDAERKANGKNLPDKEGVFEEIVVDFFDDEALKKAIAPLEAHLLLVSCDSERSQLYFKQVIPHVPYVNTPTESSIDCSTNKGKMRERMIAYNSDISPNVVVAEDASSATIEKIRQELTFPLIVKPTGLDASKLVNKVDDEQELQETLASSFAIIDEIYSKFRGLGEKTMIIEEFIDGDIYSTDVYVDTKGTVYVLPFISCKNAAMTGRDGYQIYQSDSYLPLTDEEITAGQKVAQQAVYAVGLRSSVAHIELFHVKHDGENSWKIIELGARPGGWRQETYSASYDIDHALNELLVKIDLPPEMPKALKAHSATFRVHAPEAGVVDSILGLDEAQANPSMHTLTVDVKPGDTVVPSAQGGSMLVGGLLHNTDLKQLNRDVAAVRNSISVTIKKD